ncbi:hypothetical protein ACOSP7_015780 [Xanthoceras sorbifolium]
MYDVYSNCKTVKDLWEAFEKKYRVEDRITERVIKMNSLLFKSIIQKKECQRKNFKKIKGSCWVCGKVEHKAQECRHKKNFNSAQSSNKNQANSQTNVMEIKDDLVAIVSETNMVTNNKCWWIDTGATKHICTDRNIFADYQEINNEGKLYIDNDSMANVIGKGKVLLKFTSGKILTLLDVLHVPDMRKNLVSGPLFSNKGFKLMFESDKVCIN